MEISTEAGDGLDAFVPALWVHRLSTFSLWVILLLRWCSKTFKLGMRIHKISSSILKWCILYYNDPYHLSNIIKAKNIVFKLVLRATQSEPKRAHNREFLSTVILEIKTTQYFGDFLFFSKLFIEKGMFLFYHIIEIRDEPAKHGPFDWLFLSQFKRYKLEILTLCGYRLWELCIKFWKKKYEMNSFYNTLFYHCDGQVERPSNSYAVCSWFEFGRGRDNQSIKIWYRLIP